MNQSFQPLFQTRLLRMKKYLPSSLFTVIRRLTYGEGPTNSQLKKIKLLGEDIGLSEKEIIASLDRPSGPIGVGGRQKTAIYFTMLVALVVVVIGSLFIWAVLDPETAPFKTYTPGTFYGTIRPKDFAIARLLGV